MHMLTSLASCITSCRCEGGYHACAGPADLANLPLQQMRQEAQALMADIGTSAAMQLQHVPVMIQGANGQQVVHYISMAGLQGVSQQQPTPAWPVSSHVQQP